MSLIYRGSHYQTQNMGYETVPSETVGIYRGNRLRLRVLKPGQYTTGFVPLTYRGATYYSPRYETSALAASLIEALS
ncbi:MAG: DUF4278 domain-containing protein [Cyanobacteria bacterium P01_F01_bin.4]